MDGADTAAVAGFTPASRPKHQNFKSFWAGEGNLQSTIEAILPSSPQRDPSFLAADALEQEGDTSWLREY